MKYEVPIQPGAEEDIEQAYHWLAEQAPNEATAWYNGLVDVVLRLDTFPERCPLAPETVVFHQEIRQLLYGAYRILFTIRGNAVHVLHVRHCARDYLTPQ